MRRMFVVVGAAAAVLGMGAAPAQAAQATPVACNQVVSGTVKLANDLVCPDTDGLVVGSDNTVIDLNGHRIDCVGGGFEGSCQGVAPTGGVAEADAATSDDGVDINGRRNVHVFTSVPGATIHGFDNGVRIRNSENVKVEFLTMTGPPGTILANPRPASHGVLVGGATCDGQIHLGTGQNSGNDISGHNQGIAINGDCVDVVHNRLHDNDGGLTVRGGVPTGAVPSNGLLISNGYRNVARGNEIFANGDEDASDDAGTRIRFNSADNLITNNVVSENLGDGILLEQGANSNHVLNNTMLFNGGPLTGSVFYDAAERVSQGGPPGTDPLNEWNRNNRCLTQNQGVPPGTCEPDDIPPGEG